MGLRFSGVGLEVLGYIPKAAKNVLPGVRSTRLL